MKRISIDKRFVNIDGTNIIENKIHTLRRNFAYWKKFEGQDIALFTWEGKPYRSKQKVFCVKRLVSVQKVIKSEVADFWLSLADKYPIPINVIANNDGFENKSDFIDWFIKYPFGAMAVLHFTDYRY
jgi:hypothetical protein